MATSIKLDENLKGRIQNLAQIRQRSAHWIMREAIQDYVNREESKESFKQEAIDSWESFQETGLHLSSEEARNWLSTWGRTDETTVPKCHE